MENSSRFWNKAIRVACIVAFVGIPLLTMGCSNGAPDETDVNGESKEGPIESSSASPPVKWSASMKRGEAAPPP